VPSTRSRGTGPCHRHNIRHDGEGEGTERNANRGTAVDGRGRSHGIPEEIVKARDEALRWTVEQARTLGGEWRNRHQPLLDVTLPGIVYS
jgi:hypothetical protein